MRKSMAAYIIAWTVAYILIFLSRGDGLDFRYYIEYFVLAWTFRAGELPGFIWFFSLGIFAPVAVVIVFRGRRSSLHKKVDGENLS